tara:strand:- start:3853 stop:5118 length:1266 start_codon:yes stop_codon:yes gene_type:complete
MSNFKSFLIYLLCSFSLILGLLLGENSSGGAKIDFEYLFPYIQNFALDFKSGLNSYAGDTASVIHSPVFYILLSFFYKIIGNVIIIKFSYIIICCTLPLIFYLILKDKFKLNKNILFIFSLVIFLSPYFRSSAIWLLGDNLSLIFFGLSIYYFNKIDELKKINLKNSFLCLFFLILCCYIRYYYCLFALYYLFFFLRKIQKKHFFLIIIVSFILACPAIFYFYYIFFNFDFGTTVSNYSQINFYNNSLIILSILLFYIFPFCLLQKNYFVEYLKENMKLILLIFIILFFLYLIGQFLLSDLIIFPSRGGGVFMKITDYININKLFFLTLISFLSLTILDFFFQEKRSQNYSLLLILIFSFPIFTIYQKYFDPLFFLLFFGLIKSNKFKNIFLKEKIFHITIIGYFLSFYIFSLIYYSGRFY